MDQWFSIVKAYLAIRKVINLNQEFQTGDSRNGNFIRDTILSSHTSLCIGERNVAKDDFFLLSSAPRLDLCVA